MQPVAVGLLLLLAGAFVAEACGGGGGGGMQRSAMRGRGRGRGPRRARASRRVAATAQPVLGSSSAGQHQLGLAAPTVINNILLDSGGLLAKLRATNSADGTAPHRLDEDLFEEQLRRRRLQQRPDAAGAQNLVGAPSAWPAAVGGAGSAFAGHHNHALAYGPHDYGPPEQPYGYAPEGLFGAGPAPSQLQAPQAGQPAGYWPAGSTAPGSAYPPAGLAHYSGWRRQHGRG